MIAHELADAINSGRIEIGDLLPIVRKVQLLDDFRTKAVACHLFMQKCQGLSKVDWNRLRDLLDDENEMDRYLLVIAELAVLFLAEETKERDCRRVELIEWLVRNHPDDPSLILPHANDVGAREYENLRAAWSKSLSENQESCEVLGNAARFFARKEVGVYRDILLRGKKLEPSNPWWTDRLRQLDQ